MYLRSVLWAALGLFFFSHSLFAQLSPGPLASAHADLEGLSNCTKCHEVGERVPNEKCLDCHKEIRLRQDQGSGYHAGIREKACVTCHSDHNGRDYNLIRWPGGDRNAFDHTLTGYSLEGQHQKAGCRDCHKAERVRAADVRAARPGGLNRTFLGLSTACSTCHEDAHHGQLGSDCQTCHGFSRWKPAANFQHSNARFPLAGKHVGVACDRCHLTEKADDGTAMVRFRPLDFSGCTPCHKDPHHGRFKASCDACHTADGWHARRAGAFSHDQTRFPLVGKHKQVACAECHGKGNQWHLPAFDHCSACHKDAHAGQFAHREDGGACASCHDETGFLPSLFDLGAHQKTRFALEGAHAAVPCLLCHRHDLPDKRMRFRWPGSNLRCATCHESPHRGQFADRIKKEGCEGCHRVSSWSERAFDHDRTAFPLTGRHRAVACNQCHREVSDGAGAYRLYRPIDRACATCHQDPHAGQFRRGGKTDCGGCHTNADWRARLFDHNRDARFALKGAHEKVPCEKCHAVVALASGQRGVRYRPLKTACRDCHAGR